MVVLLLNVEFRSTLLDQLLITFRYLKGLIYSFHDFLVLLVIPISELISLFLFLCYFVVWLIRVMIYTSLVITLIQSLMHMAYLLLRFIFHCCLFLSVLLFFLLNFG